jgi:hypothetical protein
MRSYQVGDILRHYLLEYYIEIIQYVGSDNYVVNRVDVELSGIASYDQLSENWRLVSSLEKELL